MIAKRFGSYGICSENEHLGCTQAPTQLEPFAEVVILLLGGLGRTQGVKRLGPKCLSPVSSGAEYSDSLYNLQLNLVEREESTILIPMIGLKSTESILMALG